MQQLVDVPQRVDPVGQQMPLLHTWAEVQQLDVPHPVSPEGQQTVFVHTLPFLHGGLQHFVTIVPVAATGVHPALVPVQAVPAGQHLREVPLPQGVVPAGQPHTLWAMSTHAIPLAQHEKPHGVVPFAQQHCLVGSAQVSPL